MTGNLDRHFTQVFKSHHLPANQKRIPRRQGGGKGLFNFTQRLAATPTLKPHFKRVIVLYCAGIHPDARRTAHVPQAILAICLLDQAVPLIIAPKRIAPRCAEIQTLVKLSPGQCVIASGGTDLSIKLVWIKGSGASNQYNMLAQHIQWFSAAFFPIEIMCYHGFKCGHTFNNLKPIGRNNHRLGRGIVAVVGPPDALNQPFDIFGRTDLDHQINVPPVNSKIKAAGAYDCAQLACGHGGFDLLPLRAIKAAVMDGNWQVIPVGKPKVMKKYFGLCACIMENERRFMLFDLLEDGLNRIAPARSGPRGRHICF